MLDQMGQRYGLLPSEILQRASTFDMVIMDISLSVENYTKQKNEKGYVPPVSTEELLKIKERA
jgi:predicted AlkP superfamily pyrophosphatase or phosphodiesterase